MIRIRREKLEEDGIYPCFVRARHHEGRPARSQGRLFIRAHCTRISLNGLYILRQSSSSSSHIVMPQKHRNGRSFRDFTASDPQPIPRPLPPDFPSRRMILKERATIFREMTVIFEIKDSFVVQSILTNDIT